jgi:mRNA interferase MazF
VVHRSDLRVAEAVIARGDFVLAAAPGDYGKPRPVLAVQSDIFLELPSVTICPLTSFLRAEAGPLRITVEPSAQSGLRKRSQIAIDKITTLSRARFGSVIGRADEELMRRVTRSVAVFLGIA